MPMPRRPIELLELNGTFRPDRHAKRRAAPKSDRGVGDPPPCMAEDEAGCWAEFAGNAAEGVLTSSDRLALECLAKLMAKARREGLSGAELSNLRGFLVELGGTPASRGRVQPAAPAEPVQGNPWDVGPPGRA